MEQGAAANIIFDDAPLDQAVEGVINGIYFNQGMFVAQDQDCYPRIAYDHIKKIER